MKIYLNIPYSEKDEARRLGAKWDIAVKKWYVMDLPNLEPFLQWMDVRVTRPFIPKVPGTKPPKHSRPDGRKFGKKANLDFLRREHEARRRIVAAKAGSKGATK